MGNKLRHDDTSGIAGTIYQFYVTVEQCFNLKEGEKLIIEKYGDITISGSLQIEVKKYEDKLTDLHENIWNTINNWLQDGFRPNYYKELILLTTQEFGTNSLFKNWNDEQLDKKKEILKMIAEKYSKKQKKNEKTERLIHSVLDLTKSKKLCTILEKFSILDSSPKGTEYYNALKDEFGKGVLADNRGDFINSLVGFIITPPVSESKSWEITFKKFTDRVGVLTNQFREKTVIFPKKYSNVFPGKHEMSGKSGSLFVKKIEEIKYDAVKNSAISDYIRTNKTISEELSKYAVPKEHYDGYERELNDSFEPQHREASINATHIINDSKTFYDKVTGSPVETFINFNDTPRYFRNGILHNMADDEAKDIKWKLKREENE